MKCCALLLLTIGMVSAADLNAIFAPLVDTRSPGLAVLVRQKGRTIFERGYGVRDLRSLARIDAKTCFRLASSTKQFTAMSIMLLVHDGKLGYGDRLTDIFPEFPAYGRAITVRHLLTHTSGLRDYEELMDGGPWTAERQIQDDEVLHLLEQQDAGKFRSGSSWSYSNSGYVLLGMIVARRSGETFPQFLQERIFVPLHMRDTLAYVKGVNTVRNRAYGHTRAGGRFVETDQSPTSATLGDGGVYSNLGDLAKWDAALAGHALLPESDMRAALTPVTLNDGAEPHWPVQPNDDNLHPGKPVAYGFGWFLDPYRGHPRMWHTGSTIGFRTVIERFTREDLTVVILCNRTDLEPDNLALKVYDALNP